MSNKFCYYCGLPATSDEHVPPQCLFPEENDAFGVSHRKNLWTVPACDKHNLRKSKDDEFLMLCITPIVGNNFTGYIQTKTKIHRAIKRRNKLSTAMLQDVRELKISGSQGNEFPVLFGKADTPRLIRILESVARGLYFHNMGERFIGKCHVIPGFVTFEDEKTENLKLISRLLFGQEKSTRKRYGENPEVFYYEIGTPDKYGFIPLLMMFFDYADVFVSFQPDGVHFPQNKA
jgi:hypothetical protein